MLCYILHWHYLISVQNLGNGIKRQSPWVEDSKNTWVVQFQHVYRENTRRKQRILYMGEIINNFQSIIKHLRLYTTPGGYVLCRLPTPGMQSGNACLFLLDMMIFDLIFCRLNFSQYLTWFFHLLVFHEKYAKLQYLFVPFSPLYMCNYIAITKVFANGLLIRRPGGLLDHPFLGHSCQFASLVALWADSSPLVMQIGIRDPGLDGPPTLRVGVFA